eukprot:TRINITY_DN74344_c0_g1_i1.p1 TRINITY_DN74344_c0_g1~~TRINITY_DN74344_c0_g1_i1.p1  ORF type:complete len:471 (-),score=75.66 TRINITY_DN74344_c0_g1_i1:122-1423(-)
MTAAVASVLLASSSAFANGVGGRLRREGKSASTSTVETRSPHVPTKLIGYYDFNEQHELPIESIPFKNLTHVVLLNAVRVDRTGKILSASVAKPRSSAEKILSVEDVIVALARQSTKLIVSLRGAPDDVAFDELSEHNKLRENFSVQLAAQLDNWGAHGAEIEWRSDDAAGGKPASSPFDAPEQYHFAMLCLDVARAFDRAAGGKKTLSVAVYPGQKEFLSGDFVRDNLDWLTVNAYSMSSLDDPHHSSRRDMAAAFGEWIGLGVPKDHMVLGIPFFGKMAEGTNDALPRPWRQIANGLRTKTGGLETFDGNEQGGIGETSAEGDSFLDATTGKVWLMSGKKTTRAKVRDVMLGGFGGIALRDLHQDVPFENSSSLLRVVAQTVSGWEQQRFEGMSQPIPISSKTISLLQQDFRVARIAPDALEDTMQVHREL